MRHADVVYVELVDMLLRPIMPVAFMGGAVGGAGLLLAAQQQDVVILALTCAVALVCSASIVSGMAYRRRAARGPLSAAEARTCERGYAAGLCTFAALLGAINARALMTPADSALVPMLVAGVAFMFGGGSSSNVAFHPAMSMIATTIATAPTVAGFLYRAATANDLSATTVFVFEAALLSGFACAGFQWARDNYETTRRQVVAKLDHATMARRDELTGLANRVQLRERFVEALASLRHSDDLIAVHYLDLDRFKAVNDSYGHAVGDDLLRAVTARLLASTRRQDTAARLGGDEFVVIQANIRHEDEARLLALRVIRAMSAPFGIAGREITIGVSVGVALAPRDGMAFEELLACADAALYDAKSASPGDVVFWGHRPPTSAAAAP